MPQDQLKVVTHPMCLTDYPTASCETPDRIASINAILEKHFETIEPSPATESDILLVHTESILKSVKKVPTLYGAALIAAGGALTASELAMKGIPSFAAVRPPGHHASPSSHWGFCFFNNVAISIEKLLYKKRIGSALILDIDLHFGDGTANFFEKRGNVAVENIQDSNRDAFLRNVDLAMVNHEYDIIAVSAGFDRHRLDWGGTLRTEDYYTIGKSVRLFSLERCVGRCFAVLEGGYNIDVLGENALALCRGLNSSGTGNDVCQV